jgi:hypothetical protein
MPEDELNQQFRRSAQEGRESLAQAVKRIEEWRNRVLLPARGTKECEMERVAKQRSRAEERARYVGNHPHLDVRMRSRRTMAAYLARQSRHDKLWTEFGHLNDEVRATLQGLRPVLGLNEVERLTQEASQSNMSSIDSMLGAVKRAADRVEEFFQACPEPAQSRRGYRCEIRQWMKNEQLGSVKGAARKLGISDSTLKSIMSDKGEKKYSDENLRRVLEKIGAPFPAPPTHHSVSN